MNWLDCRKRASIVILALFLGACGYGGSFETPSGSAPPSGKGQGKVGKPYKINGVWYRPSNDLYYNRVGNASWYGKKFHGRKTANGERYNMNALTAAHTTLPLPSYVRVTNLSNKRSLVLRINDRGPFAKGRIIDVSRRAAQLLGFAKKGVQRVRVQRVNKDGRAYRNPKGAPKVASAAKPSRSGLSELFVQVGSFADSAAARLLLPRLKGLGGVFIQPIYIGGRKLFRVRIGPFSDQRSAESALEKIWQRGFYEARIFTEPRG
ncbi:MAG: septal ring lytic transglycosylase RlpA family protein [Sphingomonadales bacterium]